MRYPKIFMTIMSLGMLLASFMPFAKADDANRMTVVTFKQPVEIPGMVLPAGKYAFRLLDPDQSLTKVEVIDARTDKAIALLLAIPDYRLEPLNGAEFVLARTGKSSPERIKVWWYPNDNMGLEFLYPEQK